MTIPTIGMIIARDAGDIGRARGWNQRGEYQHHWNDFDDDRGRRRLKMCVEYENGMSTVAFFVRGGRGAGDKRLDLFVANLCAVWWHTACRTGRPPVPSDKRLRPEPQQREIRRKALE